ncbi:MAG TPA: hypothetical protein VGD67_25055 [Pseudonocardiaceae bacterium]
MSPYRARRVAVTSPQTRLAHSQRRHDRPWRRPQLRPGEAERAQVVYQRQRRAAATALVPLGALILGLPMLLGAFPWLDDVRPAGIPLSWLLLAVLPYPALLALAAWQLRRAERVERDEDRPA